MEKNNYFYDENFVRYQLVKTNPGAVINNWIFLSGGPGIDSYYFLSLIEELDMPGNFWLIDLPANGSNVSDKIPADYHFENWGDYFLSSIQKFQNPIYIGHSFGGMFPLLFPELEELPFNYFPAIWWLRKASETNFKGTWVPQNVPTLILGGSHDFITPHSLFEKDTRFLRKNITMKKIQNAGHLPWLNQMAEVKTAFKKFAENYYRL